MLLGQVALVAMLVPGCTDDGPRPRCTIDAATPIELVFADPLGGVHAVVEGADVPLLAAPQGGRILLIGARLQVNASRCQVQVTAALRDLGNGRIVGLEQRPITLIDDGEGWVAPMNPAGLSDLANLAVCPTSTSSTNIEGNLYQLEVRMMDEAEGEGCEATALVRPSCLDEFCRKECTRITPSASPASGKSPETRPDFESFTLTSGLQYVTSSSGRRFASAAFVAAEIGLCERSSRRNAWSS